MIVITVTERDSRYIRENVKNTVAVFPANKQMLQLVKTFLALNRDIKMITDAVVWQKMDASRYTELTGIMEKMLANMNSTAKEVRNMANEIKVKQSGDNKGKGNIKDRKNTKDTGDIKDIKNIKDTNDAKEEK